MDGWFRWLVLIAINMMLFIQLTQVNSHISQIERMNFVRQITPHAGGYFHPTSPFKERN